MFMSSQNRVEFVSVFEAGCIGMHVCVCDLSRPVTLIGMAHWAHFPATTKSSPVQFSPLYAAFARSFPLICFGPLGN